MTVAVAAYLALEVASYRAAYPNGVSPLQFAMFQDNPAVRMMQGVPNALDTRRRVHRVGRRVDLQLLLAVWALLTTTRLLRGEEDLERTDLVLAGPVRATSVTALALVVVAAAGLLIGAVVTVTMALTGRALTVRCCSGSCSPPCHPDLRVGRGRDLPARGRASACRRPRRGGPGGRLRAADAR